MAIDAYKLEIHKREFTSKSGMKQMRREGKIPGVYYSQASKTSSAFYIEKGELYNIHKSGARLMKIKVGGKMQTVFFKDVQYHPVTDEVIHIDLFGVKMDEKIQILVPLNTFGEPIGVKEEGGQVTQPLQELEVLCLPSDIPEFIEVDVSHLHMSDSVHVGDLDLPENVELVTSAEAVVALVSHGVREEDTITVEEVDDDILFDDEGEPVEESETAETTDDTKETKE